MSCHRYDRSSHNGRERNRSQPLVPEAILEEDWMSEEYSEPEEDSGENKEAWKSRMAREAKVSMGIEIIEVAACPWRSSLVRYLVNI